MASFVFRLLVNGPEVTECFEIPHGISTIGRQPGCEMLLPHTQVSRQHAQLSCTQKQCQIIDLGSSNGTRVDDKKLVPQVPSPLIHEAVIKIGPFELTFQQTPVQPKPDTLFSTREDEHQKTESAAADVGENPEELKPKPQKRFGGGAGAAIPPPPSAPSLPPVSELGPEGSGLVPPGLSIHGDHFIQFLPDIYRTDFMSRFMGIFESILTPIKWSLDSFDLFLDPGTSPDGFLPWLANWFQITFDPTWGELQRRTLLEEAHQIYARRGTIKALHRILEIYTGVSPDIDDLGDDLEPFTFKVNLALDKDDPRKELINALIDAHKPVHTTHTLVLS